MAAIFLCPASRIGCQIRAHVMLWPSWQFNRCRLVTRQFDSSFADRLKLMWVQKEIGSLRREINSGGKRAGKNEDSANLIRRLADYTTWKFYSSNRAQEGILVTAGWKGGTRHAEKDDIFAIEGLSELMKKARRPAPSPMPRLWTLCKRRSGPPRTD